MGILYLDEAGNTGLWDSSQTLLIYGGPYVSSSEWKLLSNDLASIQVKYKSMIMGRFKSGIQPNSSFAKLESGVKFLSDFHFHAKDIANKKALWSKLKDSERFQALDEVIEALIEHKITFFLGVLDKEKYLREVKPKKSDKNEMVEYKFLLQSFFGYVESEVGAHANIVTIIDDGDSNEKEAIKYSLKNVDLSKFLGELICGKHNDYPILQVADIGVWIYQAFHRLDESRSDYHAEHIRTLYSKLEKTIKVTHH